MTDTPDRPRRVFPRAHIPRAVSEVCTYADATDPKSVSRARFDDCRERAGWGNLPKAASLATRMEMTWEVLKGHALDEDLDFVKSAAHMGEQRTFTAEQSVFALRIVHRRLAIQRGVDLTDLPLSADVYDRAAAAVAMESERSRRAPALRLPSARQIEAACEASFKEVCERAQIGFGSWREQSADPVAVLDRCIDEFGALPTGREFKAYARANGIGMTPPGPHRLLIAAVRARRDAAGKETPATFPTGERPDYTRPAAEWRDGRSANVHDVDEQQLLAAAGRFLDWVEGRDSPYGALPTVPMWKLWCDLEEQRGARVYDVSLIERNYPGNFGALIAAAQDAQLPAHQREAEPPDRQRARTGKVARDQGFDYDRPMIEHLRSSKLKMMLPILAYVHQHGPINRPDLSAALDLGDAGIRFNVRRLINLGALREVPALPGDPPRAPLRMVIGPELTGEALDLVTSHEPIAKAAPMTNLVVEARDRGDEMALATISSILRDDGTFLAARFAAAYGKSKATGTNRLDGLVARGLLDREQIPAHERERNEQYRYFLTAEGKTRIAAPLAKLAPPS